jgi:transposase
MPKLGETITETLESIPRQWKAIQHVREKFTCRDREKISQPRRRYGLAGVATARTAVAIAKFWQKVVVSE